MNLSEYKRWYVLSEDHWYVSKVKQFNSKSINSFAKALKIIHDYHYSEPNSEKRNQIESFCNYKNYDSQNQLFDIKKSNLNIIPISFETKLFISIKFIINGLVDLSHLERVNQKKFKIFTEIQKCFLEGKTSTFLIKEFTENFLKSELTIYYRNFKSWFRKFGFYDEYNDLTPNFTEVGTYFYENSDDVDFTSSIFSYQVKKYQIYNPSYKKNYKSLRIFPYKALLQTLSKLKNKGFTKQEFALFITKINNNDDKTIENSVSLIESFRKLDDEERKNYVDSLKDLDKALVKSRKRTKYDELLDSAGKSIDCFSFGSLIQSSSSKKGFYYIDDNQKLEEELDSLTMSVVDYKSELDWISYLGRYKEISLEEIIDRYIDTNTFDVKSIQDIFDIEVDADTINSRLLEKEIESHYEKNLNEIDPLLEIVQKPYYGRQFSTHIGPIDLLCVDKNTNQYVVLELKRGKTSDETIGQLLRYMGWVKENLSRDKTVRGIIIGDSYDKKFDFALSGIQDNTINEKIKFFKHPFSDENKPVLLKAN